LSFDDWPPLEVRTEVCALYGVWFIPTPEMKKPAQGGQKGF
jgi:hypothetical protein